MVKASATLQTYQLASAILHVEFFPSLVIVQKPHSQPRLLCNI